MAMIIFVRVMKQYKTECVTIYSSAVTFYIFSFCHAHVRVALNEFVTTVQISTVNVYFQQDISAKDIHSA